MRTYLKLCLVDNHNLLSVIRKELFPGTDQELAAHFGIGAFTDTDDLIFQISGALINKGLMRRHSEMVFRIYADGIYDLLKISNTFKIGKGEYTYDVLYRLLQNGEMLIERPIQKLDILKQSFRDMFSNAVFSDELDELSYNDRIRQIATCYYSICSNGSLEKAINNLENTCYDVSFTDPKLRPEWICHQWFKYLLLNSDREERYKKSLANFIQEGLYDDNYDVVDSDTPLISFPSKDTVIDMFKLISEL